MRGVLRGVRRGRTLRFFVIILSRTVRFAINPPTLRGGQDVNGYAGVPAFRGLARQYELAVRCVGEPDAVTGYFKDIKQIDRPVRQVVVPMIERAVDEDETRDPAGVLAAFWGPLNAALEGTVSEVCWRLSAFYAVGMSAATQSEVVIRQRFEIAAAHRLSVDSFSAEENRAIFGRCSNPSGHGHNYVIEPSVRSAVDERGAKISLGEIEALVKVTILDPFDHTHLNLDTSEFDTRRGGVNPSVENIARVFFEKLAPAIEGTGKGRLERMTVFETEKTSATYPA